MVIVVFGRQRKLPFLALDDLILDVFCKENKSDLSFVLMGIRNIRGISLRQAYDGKVIPVYIRLFQFLAFFFLNDGHLFARDVFIVQDYVTVGS